MQPEISLGQTSPGHRRDNPIDDPEHWHQRKAQKTDVCMDRGKRVIHGTPHLHAENHTDEKTNYTHQKEIVRNVHFPVRFVIGGKGAAWGCYLTVTWAGCSF
jgi:hypothetical protein